MMCVHVVDIRECRECQQAEATQHAETLIYLEALAHGLQQRPGKITAVEIGVILAQVVKLLKK